MDFEKYRTEIREPRPITVGDNPEPWHGTDVEITVQNIPSRVVLTLTVEEALILRDMLTKHLAETYGALPLVGRVVDGQFE